MLDSLNCHATIGASDRSVRSKLMRRNIVDATISLPVVLLLLVIIGVA